ncbi:glycine betaine/L-proline ABC transporter substrate-binding protein ProX [Dactylococcopsis salina]|uniref:ABC-type proline/glycine betaine transport system, periplasmic component n=1 Tax=Dactylococcopsis salina (strain PCC 8305) TaxID=13035 RepID=K9YU02_DACS8|nr:glycine betaine/L-proline ABC transporter substrate-binding protein ProX [Dactylococcopsis salina]AFZ50406.1 ABC-type proline/glycine betaine transport system, periplasmic component [Dactylococcopsis salina PCC 8305]
MRPTYKRLSTVTASLVLLLGTAACQQQTEQPTEGTSDQPGAGVEVTPAYSVLEEKFQTEIVNMALEELGYDVTPPKELEYATLHTDLANGGIHFTTVHWEKLHSDFYTNSGGDEKLERMGVFVDNVLQGYSVDKATAEENNITNLEDLKDPEIAKVFDTDGNGKANLTGCNPGWGCELVIEHHLDEYGLRDTVEHDQGQYFALMADTITRHEQGEPILYYTWTPLWVGGVLQAGKDVNWLEVPYTSLPEAQGEVSEETTTANINGEDVNLGFAVDQMRILANQQFVDEHAAAAKLFEVIQVSRPDISAQNQKMRNGEDSPEDIMSHAEAWVEENRDQFDQWVSTAREAGQQQAQK